MMSWSTSGTPSNPKGTLVSISAHFVPILHTSIAAFAFLTALFAGYSSGIWRDLCTNSVAKWPVEWFPSVSATIGDHPASRSPFHILIALCATPRFLLLGLQWLSHREKGKLSDVELAVGIARTFACGGFIYVTSRDSHNLHDFFMIVYLVFSIPWMALSTASSTKAKTRQRRQWLMTGFITTMPPLIWQYYRHSILRMPGAYTYYAFFEWSLVIWDIAFDSLAVSDVRGMKIVILDTGVERSRPISAPRDESDWTSNETSNQLQSIAAFLSDVVFGVVFWTVFTSLPFQLFYWSVWELALAGSELALLANLSPILLTNRDIRIWTQSRSGLIWLRGMTAVFGLGCYAAPLPIYRLLGVVIATSTGWLAVLSPLIRIKGGREARTEGQVLLVSLAFVTILKHMNASINPFWASTDALSGGWNITGLVISALSLWETSTRSLGLFPSAPLEVKEKAITTQQPNFLVSIGFGALVHLLHTFATDAGTIIAWTWTGYQSGSPKGPMLHPFGGVVAAVIAVMSGIQLDVRIAVPLALVGITGLYSLPNWPGFICGLAAIAGLTTAFPTYVQVISALPLAHTLGWAMAVYIILDVVSVVTVAYAFVPFGQLVRERTDLVLIISCSLIAAGTRIPRALSIPRRSIKRVQTTQRYTLISGLFLAALSIAYASWKMPHSQPVPYSDLRMFTAGIWTVHFGVDAQGRDSQHRMMELIRDMEVDVIGLLESDRKLSVDLADLVHRLVYGNRDLTRTIAEELGYYVDLGPGPNHHTWGAALLSKFPIINSTHHLLPSPRGELAPAIHATLDIRGEMVNVLVSHNGQEEDPIDREQQTTEIARLLRETAGIPTVFLGYLVTKPGAERPSPYQILKEDGLMDDIEKDDLRRWCEYIFWRGLWRIGYARVHESDITDTELQVGKFILPTPGTAVRYDDHEQMYWHIGESDIPKSWAMPAMFRDEGVRGHRYIIWIGPVYYMPPVHSGVQGYGR